MRRIVIGTLFAIGFSISLIGCSEKTKVQEKKTVTGPGGTTTETDTKEVKKTGENPPANP